MLRRLTTVIALAGATLSIPAGASAHGIGGRLDLPVPLSFFIAGAGVAIVVSFVLLAALWTQPRLQTVGESRLVADRPRTLQLILGAIGVLGLVLVVATGLVNGDRRTIGPSIVYVWFWLVVPFVAAIVGNWWLGLSPWRTLGSVASPSQGAEPPARLGLWPAAATFLAFTWLELVYRDPADPQVLAVVAIAYTFVLLVAISWLGLDRGLHHVGFMENYARLVGAISPLRWRSEEGWLRIERVGWLRGLPSLPEEPGLVAFVVVMIGTVTYDGMSATAWWERVFPDAGRDQVFGTLALLVVVAAIGGFYLLASAAAARLARSDMSPLLVARRFAHTLVPIGLAYAVAHYITLIVFEGQLLLHTASDPFGMGWNLFGTADWRVNFDLLSPTATWYIQVVAIVAGHIAGVVLAHDRALADFGGEEAARSQYAMLALMVGLTSLGLFILAG